MKGESFYDNYIMKKRFLVLLAVLSFSFLLAACAPVEEDPIECEDGFTLVDDECVEDEDNENMN